MLCFVNLYNLYFAIGLLRACASNFYFNMVENIDFEFWDFSIVVTASL